MTEALLRTVRERDLLQWQDLASCKQIGEPDDWFPITKSLDYLTNPVNLKALTVCRHICPVREQCAEETLELHRKHRLTEEIRGGWWFNRQGERHA